MKKRLLKQTLITLTSSFVLVLASCNNQAPHKHTYSKEWKYDETYHWHESTCGHDVVSEKEEHTLSNWIIDLEPTSTSIGHRHKECEICSYSLEEDIPALKDIKANRVYTSSEALSIIQGSKYKINEVVVFPYNATENLKYISSDESILTVDDNGLITSKNKGSAIISIYNDNDFDNSLDADEPVTYVAAAIKEADPNIVVTLNKSEVEITIGETSTLSASVSGVDSQSGVYFSYSSSDENVVTISEGKIKGTGVGEADVIASYQGYQSSPCHVVVKEENNHLSKIEFEEDELVIEAGSSKSISFVASPSNYSDTFTISSNNPDVATANLENNKVKVSASSHGNALITLESSNNRIARLRVVVTGEDANDNNQDYYDGYYGGLSWTDSSDLINKLHNIIKDINPLKYEGNWESNKAAEQDLYYHDQLNVIYSNKNYSKADSNKTEGYSREHVFAASLMTGITSGNAIKKTGRATDFHNLYAAYYSGNSSRGNKNLAYANPLSAYYSLPNNVNGDYVYDTSFEASDLDKGKLARSIFYMAVMYNEIENSSFKVTNGPTVDLTYQPLSIIEKNVDFSKNRITYDNFASPSKEEHIAFVTHYKNIVKEENPSISDQSLISELAYEKYLALSSPFAIGHISDLLKWNTYSVDLSEAQHNNAVQNTVTTYGGAQGNRNPFVDYPELVEYAFGSLKDKAGKLSDLTPTVVALDMNNTSSIRHTAIKNSVIQYETGESLSYDSIKEKTGIKGIKYNFDEVELTNSDYSFDSYTFVDDDVENGKDIVINTKYGEDLTVHVDVVPGEDSQIITFDTCTWSHRDNNTSGHNKGCYGTYSNGTYQNASFSNLGFVVTLANSIPESKITNSKDYGTKFGTADYPVGSITFETKEAINFDGKTKVNAVYFIASTASGESYNYQISIGGNIISSGSFTGNNQQIEAKLTSGNELTGKVKIVISKVTKAINIGGLAINAIN